MNPHLPRLRMQAAQLVINQDWSIHRVARCTGFHHSTIVRWVKKAKLSNRRIIPTESSRPKHRPRSLSKEIVKAISEHRHKYHRCAEVIHYQLTQKDNYQVSLSSVKRTLKRHSLTYPSKWKKWRSYPSRPLPLKPDVLVEIDSMREGLVNTYAGVDHRHTRARKSMNDGHVERFIRTIQQECLARTPRSFRAWEKAIPEFINYYNTARPHMELEMKTPMEVVQSY